MIIRIHDSRENVTDKNLTRKARLTQLIQDVKAIPEIIVQDNNHLFDGELFPDLYFCHANDLWHTDRDWQGDELRYYLESGRPLILYSGTPAGVQINKSTADEVTIKIGAARTGAFEGKQIQDFICAIPYSVWRGDEMPLRDALTEWMNARAAGSSPAEAAGRLRDALTGFNAALELKLNLLYAEGKNANLGSNRQTIWSHAPENARKELHDTYKSKDRGIWNANNGGQCPIVGDTAASDLRNLFFNS